MNDDDGIPHGVKGHLPETMIPNTSLYTAQCNDFFYSFSQILPCFVEIHLFRFQWHIFLALSLYSSTFKDDFNQFQCDVTFDIIILTMSLY